MSTTALSFSAQQIDQSISGGYGFFIEPNGYTGDIKLNGAANLEGINSEYIGVNGILSVTGNQVTHGNITGHNYSSLARISCTGDAFMASLTGTTTVNDLRANRAYLTGITEISQIRGGFSSSGTFNNTGTVNIGGSLFVNGVQITGTSQINQDISITGDIGTILSNRGSLLVGTGQSGVAEFPTGANGAFLKVDTSNPYGIAYEAIELATGIDDGFLYERTIGASGVDLEIGESARFFVTTRGGKIKRIEGDGGLIGGATFEGDILKNGVSAGTFFFLGAEIYGATGEHIYGTQAFDISTTAGDVIEVSITENGFNGGDGYPAKGPLRLGLYFKPD